MLGTPWPKLGLLILLLAWVGICVVGGVQKLRNREVGWKWSAAVSQRNGRDPLGYWLSTIANFVFAAAAIWLAIEIVYDRIPVN
jgi:hypothetical protein